jgi:hypothetical protein
MRDVSAAELLEAWERGRRRSSLDQGNLLIRLAWPDLALAELEAMPLGQREALLLDLRRRLFGPKLDGLTACPACQTAVEFSLEVPPSEAGESLPAEAALVPVNVGEYALAVRPPSAADLRRAAAEGRPLWEFGASRVERAGQAVNADELPLEVVAEVEAALRAADPLALIEVELTCPACGRRWVALLDTAAYLFQELESWAHETLWTVHQLATAYSWSEAEILSLSPWRRQYYLELAER